MRPEASILHLDLDAFYAAVEQRDKPSLRGKPVVVGGVGQRGVVATASYEARTYGVRSAMPSHEARRRCPHAAFLIPRFGAYQEASGLVMQALRDLSPVIEPLSLDEAYVDLRSSDLTDFSPAALAEVVAALKARVREVTGGLTASVGVAGSKFMAKIASELGKPDGALIIEIGTEVERISGLPVSVIPGVGPVTAERLKRIGVTQVADLHRLSAGRPGSSGDAAGVDELAQVIGRSHARDLIDLAWGRDDRPVQAHRETKSISVEDTFETDLVDKQVLAAIADRDARTVASRLTAAGLFARTVTIKVRRPDFSTVTRATSLLGATDRPELISELARGLLAALDTTDGVRLLGVGVTGLTEAVQEELFAVRLNGELTGPDADLVSSETASVEDQPAGGESASGAEETSSGPGSVPGRRRFADGWPPGAEVEHDVHGRGWVWGSGLGRVTVRFETRDTPPGPVRTVKADDPALHRR